MKHLKKTAIALGLAQMTMMLSGAAVAQTTDAPKTDTPAAEPVAVVVTGQRAALQSAQKIKQNSDEIVDSIVAEDMGKLPDRSVTEVLQRVVGVTIDRTMSKGDPEHFSVEGSGVNIRGLSYVRSELNGRDSFSANGGRSLNFEDVPPELVAGVDIYKNPSAEQIEGAVGGLVNLRTAMPFDYKGFKSAISADRTYSELKKGKTSPSYSGLVSNRWKTPIGEVGALLDLAYSESATRTDAFQVEPYYPLTDANGNRVFVPKGAQWRTLEFNRKREGAYGALQWKNADWSSGLTYFKSKYEMQWDEQAIFAQSSPYNIVVSKDATFNSKGALLTGTLTDPTDGGINFGDDTRTANRKSDTTDISWNLRWRVNDRWTFTTDLQHIKAKTQSFDSTVATGVTLPSETLDLTGNVPKILFSDANRAYLADPNNYYWAFTMEHMDKSKADETAWKTDGKYDFDDPVLRDFRFGVRLTKRDAVTQNSNPSYNWAAITQPWQVGSWGIPHVAYLGDPRFAGNTSLHSFDNFFNGGVSVPSVVFPNVSLAQGYPSTYSALHKYYEILCAENGNTCAPWTPATFGTDPAGTNDQSEKTKAMYGQLRFGWDDLKYPIDGNIGLRYVKTDSSAHGYTVFTSTLPTTGNTTGVTLPVFTPFSQSKDYDNSYHNVLPSLNLRLKYSDTLQFRFALASAMSRPDFTQLQGYTTLSASADTSTNAAGLTTVNSVSLTGVGTGNPMLRPITSKQVDLTAEWYFAPSGSITAAVFNKRLKDIIINQVYNYQLADTSGKLHDFTVTGPVNGAKGHARGIELAYQQYFDKLPGAWSGLGLQANFTFVDSKRELYNPVYTKYCTGGNTAANVNLNLNGCDTDGTTFGNLPLEGLSRQTYNLALLYDKGPISARLAYNWRSKALQAVNVNGTQGTDGLDSNPASATYGQHVVAWALPTWSDSYGQLDASMFYKFTDKLQLGLEAQNLTDATYKQLMQQNIGMMGRAWFKTGRRVVAKLSYDF
ncbi:TonB-dependent receptor [Duganella sp. FT80W]|uniref:TonB-dependent receptor n=1 Tax=Duganella guangzhouensis TaxID=2666084 RepID=A0A6I2L0F9_9BURK|nr:TonB-dependent receptor [Duganella guangzhouensis]MRW91302.1 TonB-dependent receptor [Duganella guangzhouensis]